MVGAPFLCSLRCHRRWQSQSGTLCRNVPWGPRSPLCSDGDDRMGERNAQQKLRIYTRGQAQLLLRDPFVGLSI